MSDYALAEEIPKGWKIPKFTKFGGETNESIVEHIARYLTEASDIANNENLRMKYFPSSVNLRTVETKRCLYGSIQFIFDKLYHIILTAV